MMLILMWGVINKDKQESSFMIIWNISLSSAPSVEQILNIIIILLISLIHAHIGKCFQDKVMHEFIMKLWIISI